MSIPGHTVTASWLYLTKFTLWPLYRKSLLVLYQTANQVQIIAIINLLSSAGKKYRSVMDADGELNNSHSMIR